MKTRLSLSFICFLVCVFFSKIVAQKHGDEWINYNQKYYTFNIVKTGAYKIDYTTLVKNGINPSLFKSEHIQVFGKEKEIPLYIVDGNDNKLDSGDYLLFHAQKNDGWLDSLLYDKPEDIGNPSYSLINDTLTYFFTWNTNSNNLRFELDTVSNYNDFTPAQYWWTKRIDGNASYYCESMFNSESSSPLYKSGEGYTFSVNGVAAIQSFNIGLISKNLIYQGPGGPKALIEVKTTSHSNADYTGKGNHHLKYTFKPSNEVFIDTLFSGHKMIYTIDSIPTSKLALNPTLNWEIINDQGAKSDIQGLNYVRVDYPTLTDLDNSGSGSFWIPPNKNGTHSYYKITNATTLAPIGFLFGKNPKMLSFKKDGSTLNTLISNADKEQELILLDEKSISQVTDLSAVNGTGQFTNFNLLSSENALLMIYPTSLQKGILEYAAYRTSIEGGSNNLIISSINELYLQFGGGVPKHFIGIRRFGKKMYDQASVKPKALFLIGKGFDNTSIRTNSALYAQCLIPTFGVPASDMAMTSGFNGNWEPLIPTSRITVTTNEELLVYLSKVQTYEKEQVQTSTYTSEQKDWQKQIIHFAGGTTKSQQDTYQYFVNYLEEIITKSKFGGKVSSLFKKSSEPIDPIKSKLISKRIKDGVSLITFFGHSSLGGFDVGVNNPLEWNNKGKYPVVYGNGCYTANVFTTVKSFSENLVNTPDLGAIAYISTNVSGFDSYLFKYGTQFYENFANSNYGNTVAYAMKKSIGNVQSITTSSYDEATSLSMNLNGDPLIKMNYHTHPEIEITPASVSINPEKIHYGIDSITLAIVLKNLGKSIIGPYSYTVKRNYPFDKKQDSYSGFDSNLYYTDTLIVKLPSNVAKSIGLNSIEVSVDLPSEITEQYDETNNNRILKNFLIDLNDILPLYPLNFAIIPDSNTALRATTLDPFAQSNRYRFEIDTSILFNSPKRKIFISEGAGGIHEAKSSDWINANTLQKEKLHYKDSTVYYWRVAIDTNLSNWKTRSFQYIKKRSGWGQAHYDQFKQNEFTKLNLSDKNRLRLFDTISKTLDLQFFDNSYGKYMRENTRFLIENEYQDGGYGWGDPLIHVVVIDPNSLAVWRTRFNGQNIKNYFGNDNDEGAGANPKRSFAYFAFRQNNPQKVIDFEDMIRNKIPDGHYFLAFTPNLALYNAWPSTLFDHFKSLGSKEIKPNNANKAFFFFCKKGDTSSVVERQSSYYQEQINIKINLKGFDTKGNEKAPLIGPASAWTSLHWENKSLETASKDTTKISIDVFNKEKIQVGRIDTLIKNIDSINLGGIINALTYPYIRLNAFYSDKLNNTPSQIKRWQIVYSSFPEATISIKDNGLFWLPMKDTFTQGQNIRFSADVLNISDYPMDSLLVNYWIENKATAFPIPYSRRDSLRVGATIRDTITLKTLPYNGDCILYMEVNPYNQNAELDQPEMYHFNNFAKKKFYIKQDEINPILDVAFDGKKIINGELIQSNPEISISLKDENDFLLMNSISDTSNFGIYITHPSGEQKRISFIEKSGKQNLFWELATEKTKKFKITYPALFDKTGTYTLSVQAADKTGNLSGDNGYKVNFEIIKESSFSYLTNYPNPFSTSTRFMYSLTGEEIPDNVSIQIMNINGRVVKEITQSELGILEMGINKLTQYAWDGKDDFGDQLGNGVYLYKVKSTIKGKEMNHRSSEIDDHFKQEFGKIYILR